MHSIYDIRCNTYRNILFNFVRYFDGALYIILLTQIIKYYAYSKYKYKI